MTGHIHAALMAEYAKDAAETDTPWERWEIQVYDGVWFPLICQPSWSHDCRYRRKPRTININGHEVPEPVRVELEEGQEYFRVALYSDGPVRDTWGGEEYDHFVLQRGHIYLTREAAEAHEKALLSFTEVKP